MPFDLPTPSEALLVVADIAVLVRVLLRPHREPASRLAWIIIVIAVPLLGVLAYLVLGETRILPVSAGRRLRFPSVHRAYLLSRRLQLCSTPW